MDKAVEWPLSLLNAYVPLKIFMLKSSPQCDGI